MSDAVNSPAHYTTGKIEVIQFIEDQKLNYNLGNALKYLCRAGKKSPDTLMEDLEKARWYLAREIELVKARTENRPATSPLEMMQPKNLNEVTKK